MTEVGDAPVAQPRSSSRSRGFPPGVGWLPALLALLAVAIASIIAAVPQYTTRTVGVVPGSGGPQAVLPGAPGAAATDAPATSDGPSASASVGPQAKGPAAPPPGAPVAQDAVQCAAGKNGGNTAAGVSASEIHVASTIVTTGVGSGFLGEASAGMQAAINEVNNAGGVCGRRVTLSTVNSGWDRATGSQDISNYINSGDVFALVAQPDSEGLSGAIESGTIDRAGIPVVGTDGLLKDQYSSRWVFPVAASTVTNMHIIAQYAVAHGAHKLGIVYDTRYKFGSEGANAFKAEVQRVTGGSGGMGGGCAQAFCGISSDSSSYSSEIQAFNNACSPCDAVVMLLEPRPMETWMRGEENAPSAWYTTLFGGEPLFDDNFASTCGQDCAKLVVWTGYHAALQPFDAESAVYGYCQSLKSTLPSADCHNEFTEGAYLGTKLFIAACQKVGEAGKPLTRENLRQALETATFSLGLSAPLRYPALPHLANTSMAAFADNAQGSFNGWNYLATGFINDPAAGRDLG